MAKEIFYPWQNIQWQQLHLVRGQSHLSHAYLFSGISGIGKKHFAEIFAHSLLCKTPTADGYSCNQCQSCHLIQANAHPDLLIIEPEEPGQMIKIDVIRSLVEWVSETALLGGHRVIIVNPAHAMNSNAANALLKTLEEPAKNTLFILISDQASRLPATIRSRCQKIYFEKPDQATALQFLKTTTLESDQAKLLLSLADGAPLKALDIAENKLLDLRQQLFQGLCDISQRKQDPLKLASGLQESDLLALLNLLQSWIKDLLRIKLTNGQSELIHFDYCEKYTAITQNITATSLITYLDHLQRSYEKILGSLNLNRLLVLEELFIRWSHYVPG